MGLATISEAKGSTGGYMSYVSFTKNGSTILSGQAVRDCGGTAVDPGSTTSTERILVLATVPSTADLYSCAVTKVGLILKSDGTPDTDRWCCYIEQYGYWYEDYAMVNIYANTGFLSYKGSDGYYYFTWQNLNTALQSYAPYLVYIKYKLTPYVVTLDNSESPVALSATVDGTSYTVAAGSTETVNTDACTVKLSYTRTSTYERHFVNWTQDGASLSTSQSTFTTISASTTFKGNWTDNDSCTIVATSEASIAAVLTYNDGNTTSATESIAVAIGETATVYLPPNTKSLQLTATVTAPAEFHIWTDNGEELDSTNPETFSPEAGHTYSLITKTPFYLTIKAPSETSITYQVGLDSEVMHAGTVSTGESVSLKCYRLSEGNVTLCLTADDLDYRTFGGWLKDGVVVDPYSNPCTLVANETATYTCQAKTTESGTASSGQILYGSDGNWIYADTLSDISYEVALSIDFEETDTNHNISWSIGSADGTETTGSAKGASATGSATVAFNSGNRYAGAGGVLYADQTVVDAARLIKVSAHCLNDEHAYAVKVTIDGTEVYSESHLSGAFNKTFKVN